MMRISMVKGISLNNLSLSSVMFIGDMAEFRPLTLALAVQREIPSFNAKEGNFNAFAIFSKPIPKPVAYENVDMRVTNVSPYIKVGPVNITAMSASALMQAGSTGIIDTETRIKHIRQLLDHSKKAPLR